MKGSADSEFELRIIVSGLCMFVPDQKGSVLHVLMPATGAHAGNGGHAGHVAGGHDEHHAVLAYSRAFTTPGSPQVTNVFDVHSMDGYAIRIGAKDGDALEPQVDAGAVVRLEPTVNFSGVDPVCVQPEGSHRVKARAELRNGKATAYLPADVSYCLKNGSHEKCQPMAEGAVWVVGRFAGPLDLSSVIELTPLRPASQTTQGDAYSTPATLPTLHPVADAQGKRAITLRLMHAVEAGLPKHGGPLPGPGSIRAANPAHFKAYYDLATVKTQQPLMPEREPPTTPRPHPMLPGAVCMLAQGEFGP